MIYKVLCFVLLTSLEIYSEDSLEDLKDGWTVRYPCEGNKNIYFHSEKPPTSDGNFDFGLVVDEEYEKGAYINITLKPYIVRFEPGTFKIFHKYTYTTVDLKVQNSGRNLSLSLSVQNSSVPEVESVLIDNIEKCRPHVAVNKDTTNTNAIVGTDKITCPVDPSKTPVPLSQDADKDCGRRKVENTGLITFGLETKPGDWPWHVAIYKSEEYSIQYICGGTVISKKLILTAAHCVTINGVPLLPQILRVGLGKYKVFGEEEAPQVKKVNEIFVHPDYNQRYFENDISLLRIRKRATFNDFVQPACIWRPELNEKLSLDVVGSVVGWGIDQTTQLSNELRRANLPRIKDLTCIKSNPVFFANAMNGKNFCAGWRNGTSACNGDSGGGYHVFIPDTPGDVSVNASGRWYVNGIISQAVSRNDVTRCDPYHYVLFTEVSKYTDWLNKYL